MRRTILAVAFFTLASATMALAEYHRYRFDLVNVSLYRGYGFPATNGQEIRDTYLELEGFHRHRVLDMYWFIDFNDINNSPANGTHFSTSHFYTELQPRISIDGLLDKDLSLFVFREWFLSYELDMNDDEYNGGLRYHNVGLGTDLALKGWYYFRGNLFARYIQNEYGNPSEGRLDGTLLNFSWGRRLCNLGRGFSLDLTGWTDLVFLARESRLKRDGTARSFQGFSQVILRRGRFGVSFALKVSEEFAQTRDGPDNATNSIARIIGLTYTFQK